MFFHEDRERLEMTASGTEPWLGPVHPRGSQIFELSWRGEALTFLIDDDRGPPFAKAAAQLADPIERERWSVAPVIAIAGGIAARATPPQPPPRERCRMAWEQLAPTDRDEVRHCASCQQDVVRVTSLAAVVALGGRRCVSYSGGD